ncbi:MULTISPECIES: cobalt-precorrin 5A hydrolase [Candidatus Nitrosocaldus]|jgi:cobalt-precorrin 5A hydrolase|uniref:Cobalt-precorrin-5A hydrolase n=1 Tax=Candidatus Nitrosocaldus cavascurensis TaxID=2058097 RepID=A0A2K5AT50_9ARCH|nr:MULTISPECIES: cobalamin biosynthesis protein [Candidatus Nitrosocaldus]SPC34807.1 Cobalt-precorrin-5A hydrolase [Candidatus Nitrosocaldus cavascurensis]
MDVPATTNTNHNHNHNNNHNHHDHPTNAKKGRVAVVAITKHGLEIAGRLKSIMREWDVYAPEKFRAAPVVTSMMEVNWYNEPSAVLISRLFNSYNALICIFSLGAVIRMIAPYIRDKRSDPAVLVIDDAARFVISALSGHLGGANALARLVARILNSTPVITTAADVNETIAVDLLGSEFGWRIDEASEHNITMLSAAMVNEEPIGIYQDAGERGWWSKELPKNVRIFNSIDELNASGLKALIITDRLIDGYAELLGRAVVYRPKSLVVGLGLHWDTSSDEIARGIENTFKDAMLSMYSIRCIATLERGYEVKGLKEFSERTGIPVEYYTKEQLASIKVPNPSTLVKMYEGTPSVAEAAALASASGKGGKDMEKDREKCELVVEKRKFPPNLTVAVARIIYDSQQQ